MGLEIERKFLVISDAWTDLARNAARLEQGYLAFAGAAGPEARVRVSTPLGYLDGHGFSENPEPKTFQDAFQDAVEYAFIPLRASSSGALDNEAATATFTVKGKGTISRTEIESDIPVRDAVDILAMCEATVKKVRHTIAWGDVNIEVDVFEGHLAGLVTAEIELPSEDHVVDLPAWLGEDVTANKAYKNGALAQAKGPPEPPAIAPRRPSM